MPGFRHMKLTAASLALALVIPAAATLLAETPVENKVRMRQTYTKTNILDTKTKVTQTYLRNTVSFSAVIKGDFSQFGPTSTLGVKIGNMDVLSLFTDGTQTVGFSNIQQAIALGSTGLVVCKVYVDKGYGFVRAKSTSPYTVGTKTMARQIETVSMDWNAKRLKITVSMNERYLASVLPELPTLPYDLTSLSQWVGRTFEVDMMPVTISFGSTVYVSNTPKLRGRAQYELDGSVASASGDAQVYYLTPQQAQSAAAE